jgi:hypothetical protein
MTVKEFYQYIKETDSNTSSDEEYSKKVFDTYLLLLLNDTERYNDFEIFYEMIRYSNFRLVVPNDYTYLQSLTDIYDNLNRLTEEGEDRLTELEENLIRYVLESLTLDGSSQEHMIEFLYNILAKGLYRIFIDIVYKYNSKININYPTKYGFPLFWEILYLAINASYSKKGSSSTTLVNILSLLRFEFPDFDINNRGNKNYGIFSYLFDLKWGATSQINVWKLIDIVDSIINSKNFKPYNKEIEESIFKILNSSQYLELVDFIIKRIDIDYTFTDYATLLYDKRIKINIFEYLFYIEHNKHTTVKMVDFILKKYKPSHYHNIKLSKPLVSNLIFSNAVSKFKNVYFKFYTEIKSHQLSNINEILDSIE